MNVRPVPCTLFCVVCPVCSGQSLEATVYLPDSLGGMTCPQCLTYNSTNNTIYVAGELGDCVIAIDARDWLRVVRIPASRAGDGHRMPGRTPKSATSASIR